MLIRVEIPVDAVGIDVLLHRVFGRDDEADLVQQLREAGLLTLGIVATDNKGGIVGYAAFSPVNVAGEDRAVNFISFVLTSPVFTSIR